MRIEAEQKLNNILQVKLKTKHDAARKIQKAYRKYRRLKTRDIFIGKIRKVLANIRRIQKLWKVRKYYQAFQRMRKAVRRIKTWWKSVLFKRRVKKMRKAVTKISAWWKSYYLKAVYIRKLAAARMINRVLRGARVRRKQVKLRHVKEIIEVALLFLRLLLKRFIV